MVDVIDNGFRVDELDEIFDNLYDIGVRQNTDVIVNREIEFLVETISSDISENSQTKGYTVLAPKMAPTEQ